MIKIEETSVHGFEEAIRGMRNPMNSWNKSDSEWFDAQDLNLPENLVWAEEGACDFWFCIGQNDQELMKSLAKGGPVHAKYRRMITVYCDILAPLYWWKEFDTYKVGTVANSCSTMHKIHAKEFSMLDFSLEHLSWGPEHDGTETLIQDRNGSSYYIYPMAIMKDLVDVLNHQRAMFVETGDKKYWWQMIQMLPSSYNQLRTVMLNYEVLHNIYISRKDHKLDEWREFCEWIKTLPFSKLITMEE